MDGLGARGARLWAALLERDGTLTDETNPMREVALTACRTADRCEHLERLATEVDVVFDGRGGPSMHPVYPEVARQAALLARLVAALRLPDEATGAKPQRRPLRGAHAPAAVNIRARVA